LDLICWDNTQLGYVLGIRVQSPEGWWHSPEEELVPLDTGYDGELLVPWQLYEELRLYRWEYPQRFWAQGHTVSGETIQLYLSEGRVEIPRTHIRRQVLIDSFVGNTEFLLGRAFLRGLQVLLDGQTDRTCLSTSEH